jgi:hypothetical protein
VGNVIGLETGATPAAVSLTGPVSTGSCIEGEQAQNGGSVGVISVAGAQLRSRRMILRGSGPPDLDRGVRMPE